MFVPRCSFVFSASIFNLLVLLFHEMRDYIVLRTRERSRRRLHVYEEEDFLSFAIGVNLGIHVRVLSDKPLSRVHIQRAQQQQPSVTVLYSQGTVLHDYRMTTPSYTTINHHIPRITCSQLRKREFGKATKSILDELSEEVKVVYGL